MSVNYTRIACLAEHLATALPRDTALWSSPSEACPLEAPGMIESANWNITSC